MAQWLTALLALPEDPGSVHSHLQLQFQGDPMPLPTSIGTRHTYMVYTHMCRQNGSTQKIKMSKSAVLFSYIPKGGTPPVTRRLCA